MAIDLSLVYASLLPITHAHGADVDDEFFEGIAEAFEGGSAEFIEHVKKMVPKWYRL